MALKNVDDILKENDLYNKNIKAVKQNMPDEFFKNYTINKTSYNPFPTSIVRNKDGRIEMDEIPYVRANAITSGHTGGRWYILSNGSRIFVKEDNMFEEQFELLFNYLCKKINVCCADYDLVKLDGKDFIASQSFLKVDETLVDYYDLERQMTNFKPLKQESNVCKIETDDLLKKARLINQENHALQALFIDALTDNYDRMPHNLMVIKNNDGFRKCPLFDNGSCCDAVDKRFYQVPAYQGNMSSEAIFDAIISYDYFYKWLKEKLKKLDISEIPYIIYKDKGIAVPNKMYCDFEGTVNKNLKILNESMKKNKRQSLF